MSKIVILHTDVAPDAPQDEQDALDQAQTIAKTLEILGHQPVLLPFVLDLQANMEKIRLLQPAVVFNLVETMAGRGSLQYFAPALLDFLHIPYTGSKTQALFLTTCKPLAKKILAARGIATPPWMTSDGIAAGKIESDRVHIIKPSWEDASVGLEDDAFWQPGFAETLPAALSRRKQATGLDCFAEVYIEGREFNIALLATREGPRLLPPAEILFLDYPPDKLKLLNYRSKWAKDSFEYHHTPRFFDIPLQDGPLMQKLQNIALACWDLFDLRGYARVDFRVDEQGAPFVLEINANPCLSPDAGFAAALEKAGITYSEAIDEIIQDALPI